MTTQLAANTYTRIQVGGFDEEKIIPVSTGFQSIFARPGMETLFQPNSSSFSYDIMRGDETMSKLVSRGNISRLLGPNQQNVNRGNYTSVERSYPLSIEESDISTSQALKRLPNEPQFNSNVTKEQRRLFWAMKEHQKQVKKQVKMFERLARQSVLEGKQDSILDTTNTDEQYDFYRSDRNSITLSTQWTDANGTPVDDIDDALIIGRETGKRTMDFGLCGDTAIRALIKNAETQSLANNRRYELISIKEDVKVPTKFKFLLDGGWTAAGILVTYRMKKVWLFTNDDIYTDDNGDAVKYMPDGKVVLGYSGAETMRAFGPSETFDELPSRQRQLRELFGITPSLANIQNVKNKGRVLDPRMFYFDAYTNRDYSSMTMRTQSAPIFITKETDAWVVIENAA